MSTHDKLFPAFDALKVIAAFGIVWFHTPHAIGREIGYAGLLIFLLISFIVLSIKSPSYSYLQYLRQRGKRLLIPWIVWNIFYGLLTLRLSHSSIGVPSLSGILTGTAIHLWYLPFAFLASYLVFIFLTLTRASSPWVLIIVSGMVTVLWLISYPMFDMSLTGNPWRQWSYGFASIPLGIALGQALKLPQAQCRWVMLAILAMMLAICVYLIQMDKFGTAVSYMTGTALIITALLIPMPSYRWVTQLSALTFGIYLLHPFIFMICYKLFGSDVSTGLLMAGRFFGALL
ncbi:MAG: acyltransferase family protein [Thiotrichaceae bacterium]